MGGRIWVDVEDMFIYTDSGFNRPTGIQRLAFELCRAMHELQGRAGMVQFLRQDPVRASFTAIPFADLENLFERWSTPQPPVTDGAAAVDGSTPMPPQGPAAMAARRMLYRLPVRVRKPLTRFAKLQLQALGAFGDLTVNTASLLPGAARRTIRLARRMMDRPPAGDPAGLAAEAPAMPSLIAQSDECLHFSRDSRAGDILFTVGAGWFHPDYPGLVRRACADHGLRYALLVYDIIPLRRPEWCDRPLVPAFRRWFEGLLPLCHIVLSISDASAREVLAYAAERKITLPGGIRTIPIGTGFAKSSAAQTEIATRAGTTRLPAPGSYALFVSTIEARKNHTLLFRVWRHMLEQMPRDSVPTLVFAGRIGWLVADLMQQIENAEHLGGKLVVVEHPTDAELEALYRGCQFTLFPSLYEGWGLPVSESLAFGKPCIISGTTSLPEAGGALARYFDPEDVGDALRVIRATIEDPAGLAEWQARVVREFRPVQWEATAQAVMDELLTPARIAAE